MVQRRGSPPVPLSLLPISISDMVFQRWVLVPALGPGSGATSWVLVLGPGRELIMQQWHCRHLSLSC